MKKKFALADIEAGDSFSRDAFVEGNNIFVPAGVAVRERDMEGLRRWEVTHVFSEGELVKKAAREAAAKKKETKGPVFKDTGGSGFVEDAFFADYAAILQDAQSVFQSIQRSALPESGLIEKINSRIMKMVDENESQIVAAIIGSNVEGYEEAKTAVNCTILSLVVGKTMKLPAYRLQQLALGAFLHDIGMIKIPQDILKKTGKLSVEEMQKLKSHPLYSYRAITRELHFPEDVGLIGLQHHERWDGEGYPRKTVGAEIDILARIVSVTDAFEAMISQKSYRNSMIGYAAMKSLLSDNGRRFDPDVLKAFLRSMGIYPIGSIVVLNNSAIAKVVTSHADAPLRPCLRVLVDEFGNHYKEPEGEVLDLLTEKTLFIARAIDPRELVS
ncbi:MAG: HD-GYP domain-containing protein [Spirochaetes bacterium]|nr:HD-GYP domain-containing protein [Spirochaetota bacterium]MBU0955017.1 HD-GYP domain-containing protein [Spirochaetota bacterium]